MSRPDEAREIDRLYDQLAYSNQAGRFFLMEAGRSSEPKPDTSTLLVNGFHWVRFKIICFEFSVKSRVARKECLTGGALPGISAFNGTVAPLASAAASGQPPKAAKR